MVVKTTEMMMMKTTSIDSHEDEGNTRHTGCFSPKLYIISQIM